MKKYLRDKKDSKNNNYALLMDTRLNLTTETMSDLWVCNSPEKFWICQPSISEGHWHAAIKSAFPLLGLIDTIENVKDVLALTLGEGRLGDNHWKLSLPKHLYYSIKPLLPRPLIVTLRQVYNNCIDDELKSNWPVDTRYPLYQWEVLRQVLLNTSRGVINYKCLWPAGSQFAFTLTHDIETAAGQAFVRKVADLEERLGFRSSFNFVLERYPLDIGLMHELRERGFEVGCHELKHDGRLFSTKTEFVKRAAKINEYMKKYSMVGFRSPLTHRNPEWMQALEIEYDLSFFDTDPFEPIPGGAMSIWPFFIGHFVELPYTLVQDHTLTSILGETSPRIWLEKVAFLKKYHGLALANSHPDYLMEKNTWKVYEDFLTAMKDNDGYWHALPREVASWWRLRAQEGSNFSSDAIRMDIARLENGQLVLGPEAD